MLEKFGANVLQARAFIQPREDIKIETDQSLNASPATYVGVALRNRKLHPPIHPHTRTHTHTSTKLTFFFFHNKDVMRALSFLSTAVCSQCWKKHAQLMKSKPNF